MLGRGAFLKNGSTLLSDFELLATYFPLIQNGYKMRPITIKIIVTMIVMFLIIMMILVIAFQQKQKKNCYVDLVGTKMHRLQIFSMGLQIFSIKYFKLKLFFIETFLKGYF